MFIPVIGITYSVDLGVADVAVDRSDGSHFVMYDMGDDEYERGMWWGEEDESNSCDQMANTSVRARHWLLLFEFALSG